MRVLLLISLFIISVSTVSAQTNSDAVPNKTYPTSDSSIVFTFCEVMPVLKTKEYKSFEDYVAKNTIYPADARAKYISGSVYIEFIIEIDGSVSNVKIVKGRELYPACDQEAMRVISNSPKWTPAMHNGKAVRIRKVSRISFNLTDSK